MSILYEQNKQLADLKNIRKETIELCYKSNQLLENIIKSNKLCQINFILSELLEKQLYLFKCLDDNLLLKDMNKDSLLLATVAEITQWRTSKLHKNVFVFFYIEDFCHYWTVISFIQQVKLNLMFICSSPHIT